MTKLHIKKGDTVYVNAGEDKGKTGRVLEVDVQKDEPSSKGSILYPGTLSLMQKALREAYLKKRPPVHISNLNPLILNRVSLPHWSCQERKREISQNIQKSGRKLSNEYS